MVDGPLGWDALLDGAVANVRYDKDEIKSGLPLEWVLTQAGVVLEPADNGRLVGLCPFHDEETPSFAIYGDDLSRAGCWGCGFDGDLFDIVGRLYQLENFREQLSRAGAMATEFAQDTGWTPRAQAQARPKADPVELHQRATEAYHFAGQEPTALLRLIDEKRRSNPGWHAVEAEWLRREWLIGALDDWTVTVPHLSKREGDDQPWVRGIKTRTPRSHLYAQTGSDLGDLYGIWRDAGQETVVLAEGESDAWCAQAALGQGILVLALPSGAGTPPKPGWIEHLRGRRVILAFDGDLAGRKATRRWHRALTDVAQVYVASLPDGEDLSSTHDLQRVVFGATEVLPDVAPIIVSDRHYNKRNANGDLVPLCNWSMQPERELEFEDGRKAYEGYVLNRAYVLGASDLASEGAIKNWSAAAGGNWLGTGRDAQALLGSLETEGPFLARGKATTIAGWHDGNFVWPGGRIGPDYWRYVPPAAEVNMSNVRIEPAPWDQRAIPAMLALHRQDVMHPILAWMAAAPLRSLFRTFPFLAVTGTSGSGKTTLIEAITTKLGWRIATTLTGSTPHAVQAFAGATNGIPVHFDEYRPGAREDALQAFNQVLRDAYDGTASNKGGGTGDNKQRLQQLPTSSPIVVTGEDAFSETSHVERMILVELPSTGKNPAAMRELGGIETAGLGWTYLSWLVASYRDGTLPSIHVDRSLGRIDANMQTLHVGWSLLRAFHQATTGEDLPEPDFTLVQRAVAEAAATSPVHDALVWAIAAQHYGGPCVFYSGDDVMVNVVDFVNAAVRANFTLPGRAKAIKKLLEQDWNGHEVDHGTSGRLLRLVGMAPLLRKQD